MSSILERFNLVGFNLINSWVNWNEVLDWLMIFAADKMGYLLILGVLFLAWKNSDRIKVLVLTIGSAILARVVFVELIRYFIYNPRPYLVLEKVNILMNHEVSSSFPSGHTTFYFAIAMGVYLYNKKAGWVYFILAGLLGFARIFVSVHWPLDILAGAGLGIATARSLRWVFDFLKQKMSRRTLLD